MTIKELKELIKDLPDNAEVESQTPDRSYRGDYLVGDYSERYATLTFWYKEKDE